MASCQTCKTTILWGGVKKDGRRYCNAGCMEGDELARIGDRIPEATVMAEAKKIMKEPCPECHQVSNDVEMRSSYRAISFIVMTTWSKNPILSCSSCHRKKVLGDGLTTFFLGWWGFPFGLILTPVQLIRNISALASPKSGASEPSAELCSFVRSLLAHSIIESSFQQASPESGTRNTPPPIPRQRIGADAKPIEPGR